MITYSIIQKSQLEGALRLDAEYYQPDYLKLSLKLKNQNSKLLEEITESVVSFGAYSLTNYIEWKESGVPYLNVEDIRDGRIEFDGTKFISEKVDEILKKSRVREGQVIITMAGTIGEAAVAHKIPKKVNSNQATAKITLKQGYSPYYLAAFLNSYFGKKQTEREIVSSVQPNIFLGPIKNLRVFIPTSEQQKTIEETYKLGLDEYENSKSLYSQAEDLLLEELGLKDFKIEDDLSYIVNLSDIKFAHRADAEYFQPKYEKLIKHIEERVKMQQLKAITTTKRGSLIDPRFYNEAEGTPYIRGKDFSSGRLEKSGLVYIDIDFQPKNETRVNVGDLVFALIGSVGTSALVNEAFHNSFISNNIGKISIKDKKEVLPEYLAIVLNSIIGKLQFGKEASQTAQPKISDVQVRNFYIPILPKPTQQKIADLVRRFHEARRKAKELLKQTKQKVEKLIEK